MDEPVSQSNIFSRFFGFISSSGSSRTLGALAILIVAAAIPLTVYISQQRQETRQQASTGENSGSSSISNSGTGCAVAKANNGPNTINNYCAFNLAQPPRTFNRGPAELQEGSPCTDAPPEIKNAGGYYEGWWCQGKSSGNDAMQKAAVLCSRGSDGCDYGGALNPWKIWMSFTGRAWNSKGSIPDWTSRWNDTQARRSVWNSLMAKLKLGGDIYYQSPGSGTAIGDEYDLSIASSWIFPPPPPDQNGGALWWGYQLQREKDNNCAVNGWDKLCLADSDCQSGFVCERDWGNCPSNHPPSFTCVPASGGGGNGGGGTPPPATGSIGGKITDCVTGKGIGGVKILMNHGNDKLIEDTNPDGTWASNLIAANDVGYGIWPQCVSGLDTMKPYAAPSGYLCNSSIGPKASNAPHRTWAGTSDFPNKGDYYDVALDGLPNINGSPSTKNFDFCYTPTSNPPSATSTPIPAGSGTPIPTASPTPAPGSTTLSFNLILPGVGGLAGNPNPLTPTKQLKIQVFNSTNQQVGGDKTGNIIFDSQSGMFKGTVNLGVISSGTYTIKVKTDRYLRKLISGVQNLVEGLNQMPQTTMVVGDINGDNKLNIADYNIIVTCFGNKANSSSCGAVNKQAADLNDDGKISDPDYKLFIDSLSVQEGD